ncbi:hypothetical protein [Rhodococcus sp. NPDC057529]
MATCAQVVTAGGTQKLIDSVQDHSALAHRPAGIGGRPMQGSALPVLASA